VKLRRLLACFGLIVLLCACATPRTQSIRISESALQEEAEKQKDLAARAIVGEQLRLARAYRKLATSAHHFCGKDLAPSTGASFFSASNSELSTAYARQFGISEKPTVLFVLEDSPASLAGLRSRDVLTHLNGQLVPDMARFAEIFRTLAPDELIRATVVRDGGVLNFAIQPEKACSYAAVLHPDQAPNAFADGTRIMVTRGMMDFAKDDFELSLVLAHELAHNVMRHMDAKMQNMVGDFFAQVLGAMVPGGTAWSSIFTLTGTTSYSQEFEAEADYVGSYILAAAGLPFGDAPKFWRRMAASNPSHINPTYAGSHRSIPHRMLALEAAVSEIKVKSERGLPLEPNMRDGLVAISEQ